MNPNVKYMCKIAANHSEAASKLKKNNKYMFKAEEASGARSRSKQRREASTKQRRQARSRSKQRRGRCEMIDDREPWGMDWYGEMQIIDSDYDEVDRNY